MFKHLIKKVREESNNASILIETNSDEINDSLENLKSTNKQLNSNTQVKLDYHRTLSIETDKNEERERISKQDLITIEILKRIDLKEEILKEKDDDIQILIEQTNNLQNELILLRNKLFQFEILKQKNSSENTIKTPYLQKQIDIFRLENENLKLIIKNLRIQLNDVEAERDDLLIKSTDITYQKQENKRLLINHETQTNEDKSFIQIFTPTDVDTINKLQTELDEKNRTIKILQERYNDLRKTLQREFHTSLPKDLNQMGSSTKANNNISSSSTTLPLIHYDSSTISQRDLDTTKRTSTARKNVTETSPTILPNTTVDSTTSNSTKIQKKEERVSIDGQVILNNTNLKYLKHVILKFITSTEDEAIHLIRAVSTLLNFSLDEERLLRETLDYKMSWFGKVPRLKS